MSDTVTNGFEFSVTRERFRPAGTSADRDCSRSSPASRCRTSHGPAGSISEAHGLQMSRIPPRAPFPNGIARGRRCRLRSKFAADSLLEGNGFELPVPGREAVNRDDGPAGPRSDRICCGTEGSNPSPSSGESRANQDFLSRYDGKGGDRIANTEVSPFIVSNSSAIATSHRATHPLNR